MLRPGAGGRCWSSTRIGPRPYQRPKMLNRHPLQVLESIQQRRSSGGCAAASAPSAPSTLSEHGAQQQHAQQQRRQGQGARSSPVGGGQPSPPRLRCTLFPGSDSDGGDAGEASARLERPRLRAGDKVASGSGGGQHSHSKSWPGSRGSELEQLLGICSPGGGSSCSDAAGKAAAAARAQASAAGQGSLREGGRGSGPPSSVGASSSAPASPCSSGRLGDGGSGGGASADGRPGGGSCSSASGRRGGAFSFGKRRARGGALPYITPAKIPPPRGPAGRSHSSGSGGCAGAARRASGLRPGSRGIAQGSGAHAGGRLALDNRGARSVRRSLLSLASDTDCHNSSDASNSDAASSGATASSGGLGELSACTQQEAALLRELQGARRQRVLAHSTLRATSAGGRAYGAGGARNSRRDGVGSARSARRALDTNPSSSGGDSNRGSACARRSARQLLLEAAQSRTSSGELAGAEGTGAGGRSATPDSAGSCQPPQLGHGRERGSAATGSTLRLQEQQLSVGGACTPLVSDGCAGHTPWGSCQSSQAGGDAADAAASILLLGPQASPGAGDAAASAVDAPAAARAGRQGPDAHSSSMGSTAEDAAIDAFLSAAGSRGKPPAAPPSERATAPPGGSASATRPATPAASDAVPPPAPADGGASPALSADCAADAAVQPLPLLLNLDCDRVNHPLAEQQRAAAALPPPAATPASGGLPPVLDVQSLEGLPPDAQLARERAARVALEGELARTRQRLRAKVCGICAAGPLGWGVQRGTAAATRAPNGGACSPDTHSPGGRASAACPSDTPAPLPSAPRRSWLCTLTPDH